MAPATDIKSGSAVVKLFYFLTSLGHESVMVFFVISGYLVGGLTMIKFNKRGFDLLDFTIHRTSRIYTVLVPALVIGGALDWIGLSFFNQSQLYTAAAQYHTSSMDFSIQGNLNFPTLLANLANLETMISQRLGSNSPLWSLVFEWWYYALFAAVMTLAVKKGPRTRVIAGAALVVMLLALPHVLVIWGVMWLVGVAAAIYGQTRGWKPPVWLALAALAAAVVVSRLGGHNDAATPGFGPAAFARDLGVSIAFASLLLSFHHGLRPIPFAQTQDRLAGFSYTLYLTHFPAMVFIVAALNALFGVGFVQPFGAASLGYMAGVIALVVGYAWLLSRLTEAHTPKIRAALTALAKGRWVGHGRAQPGSQPPQRISDAIAASAASLPDLAPPPLAPGTAAAPAPSPAPSPSAAKVRDSQ